MRGAPSWPSVRDPVVVDGVKLRIREITPAGIAVCRQHFAPHEEAKVSVERLVWDRRAGLWRVAS